MYKYEYQDLNGSLVQDNEGNTGTIRPDKLKAWQIKNIERSLTAKHLKKCIVKYKGTI